MVEQRGDRRLRLACSETSVGTRSSRGGRRSLFARVSTGVWSDFSSIS